MKRLAEERGDDLETMTPAEIKTLKEDAQQRFLATAFLLGADKQRYGKLITETENDYLKTGDPSTFPTTVTQVCSLLTHNKGLRNNNYAGSNDGVAFAHMSSDEVTLANAGAARNLDNIRCNTCGQMGHYANRCPNKQGQQPAAPPQAQGQGQIGQQLLMAGVEHGVFDDYDDFSGFTFTVIGEQAGHDRNVGITLSNDKQG